MAYINPARSGASINPSWTGKMAARRDPISQAFSSPEEREIAQSVVNELKASDKNLFECMSRLVLANVNGYKMDVIGDFVRKFPRYGSFTPKQRDYAVSIITEHHLPKLLELLAEEGETGETAVEEMPAEVSARQREQMAAKARVDAKRQAYREKQEEIARVSEAVADYETESNATFGMF